MLSARSNVSGYRILLTRHYRTKPLEPLNMYVLPNDEGKFADYQMFM